ncbi:MAG TPA: hypothetical protein VFS92_02950 [Planctomycetota bacterium]|nr:hypothetical protein [Planctomycetota bacterium]
MKRLAARVALMLAIPLAAAGGAARGEEPAPAPAGVKLVFGFPLDAPLRFVLTRASKDAPSPGTPAGPGAPPAIEKTVTAEVSLELAAQRKDGTFEALLGFGRIGWVSDLLGPGGSELRSDRALPKEAPVRAAALRDLILGSTTTAILIDPTGLCRGVTEDSLEHKARTTALGLDKAEAATLPALLAGPRLLREYGRVVATLPVPAEPVSVGGTFGIATPVGEGEGRTGFYASQTLTVTAVEADAIVVEGKGRVAWADDERARKAGEPLPEVKVLRSEVSSRFRIARADGLPLAGSWEFEWAWQRKEPGEETFHRREGREKSTLQRVAAWPSGAK